MLLGRPMLCTTCLTVGVPQRRARGSLLLEIVLWLCAIIPGLVYSAWRLSSRRRVCRACGGKELIPVDSPRARQLTGS